MKRMLLAVAILVVTLSTPLSAEKIEGYLIDKMCSTKVASEGVDAAKKHEKDCALMARCKGSGYGVFTADGKFLKFDEDGDRMALKVLGFASEKDNLKVVVNGEVKGNSIAVVAIQLE